LLVLLGLASFVLGLVAVYLITNDDGDDSTSVASDRVAVLVANGDISAGQLGSDLITADKVHVEEVSADQKQPDALTSPSQLSNTRLTASFLDGEQIQASGIQSLGGARAEIPEGYEAVALSIDYVAAGANTIIPGDPVNIYIHESSELPADASGDGIQQQAAKVQLLLTNVPVLDVQQGAPGLTISQPTDGTAATATGGKLIVVVAVNSIDAEKVIYGSTTSENSLYLSRVRVDDSGNPSPASAGDPDGRTFSDILAESPADAAARYPQTTNGEG
jgi:Flp pilus assembly protein CpaB